MTRKRFVKLLMAKGCSRNEANLRAREVVRAGDTYWYGYFAFLLESGDSDAIEAMKNIMDRMVQAANQFIEAFMRIAKAFTEALPSLAEMAQENAAE